MIRYLLFLFLLFSFETVSAQAEHQALLSLLHDEDDLPVSDSALAGKVIIIFTNKTCLSCFPPLEEKLKQDYPGLSIVYLAATPDGPLQFESMQRRIAASIKYKPVAFFAYEEQADSDNVWKERLMQPSPQLYIPTETGTYQYRDYNWVGNYLKQ